MQSSILALRVATCSEFPNDNPALHRGAVWVSTAIGGEVLCELPISRPELEAAAAAPPLGEEFYEPDALDDGEPIEIVDDLGFDEIESKPAESEAPEDAVAPDPFLTLATVVKDVARTFGADASGTARLDLILGLESSDEHAAPQAVAWRGILRGESEDYEACGAASLDEWAADVVARVIGGAARADGIRRELRRRGVAAFGLVA
jgi:hypothetical protein